MNPLRTENGTGVVRHVFLDALIANATPWAGGVADLRADACGHGAGACASALRVAGIRRAVVDPPDRAAVRFARLDIVDGDPDVVPEALFGLTGVGAPVMALEGTVLQTKDLRAGEGVSYGYRHRATTDTRIAMIAGGYAQGIVRSLGGRVAVQVGGRRRPIVGRVAMDVCVVDIGEDEVAVGDPVVFFGDPLEGEPPLEAWVQESGLRATEILTALGPRTGRQLHVTPVTA